MDAPATVELSERWKAILWRQEELERAGWPIVQAALIAEDAEIDLHRACDLVRRGATVEQALKILL